MQLFQKITAQLSKASRKELLMLIFGGLLLFIGLFLLFLTPLARAIAIKKDAWKKFEVQLVQGRIKSEYFYKMDKTAVESLSEQMRKRLPTKSQTSAILEELTSRGKELGIEFVSITPLLDRIAAQTAQATGWTLKFDIIPFEINMRATYKGFGEYLGVLENLESTFATTGEFQVRKEERIYPKLNIRLIVYTYTAGEQSGQK